MVVALQGGVKTQNCYGFQELVALLGSGPMESRHRIVELVEAEEPFDLIRKFLNPPEMQAAYDVVPDADSLATPPPVRVLTFGGQCGS